MTKQDEQWLLDLKEQIEEAKEESNKLLGKESNLLESLKEDFGITSIEEGLEHVKELEEEVASLDKSIIKDLKEIEEKLEVLEEEEDND
jgi:uncharacterized protein YoxC